MRGTRQSGCTHEQCQPFVITPSPSPSPSVGCSSLQCCLNAYGTCGTIYGPGCTCFYQLDQCVADASLPYKVVQEVTVSASAVFVSLGSCRWLVFAVAY